MTRGLSINYYLSGLLPAYVSQVVISSPADLNAAVTRAKLVETGTKLMLQNSGLIANETPTVNNNPVVSTPITLNTPTPEATIAELTKQMEQLSINYANLQNTVNR